MMDYEAVKAEVPDYTEAFERAVAQSGKSLVEWALDAAFETLRDRPIGAGRWTSAIEHARAGRTLEALAIVGRHNGINPEAFRLGRHAAFYAVHAARAAARGLDARPNAFAVFMSGPVNDQIRDDIGGQA